MLIALQSHGFPQRITGANLKKRWDRYYAKYKEARNLKCQSGGGLSQDDYDAGLSLEDKLNKICPHFERMHVLLGNRLNVAPRCTGDWGIPDGDELLTRESDNEDEPDWMRDTEAAPASPTMILTKDPASVIDAFSTGESDQWLDDELLEIAREEVRHSENLTVQQEAPIVPQQGTTPSVPPVQLRQTAGPEARGTAHKENCAPRTKGKKVDDKSPQGKTNVAQIYTKRLLQKVEYQKDLIQNRDKWKMAELDEKKQARLDSATEFF